MSFPQPALLGGPPVRPEGVPLWPRRSNGTDTVFSQLQDSGDWGRYHGPHAEALSRAMSQTLGVEHLHLCSSGTAAVELALRGTQVGPGDEVILSAYDFKSNFTNIALLGATPVLVDCRGDDAQLDVTQLELAITDKTKAIIASHLQGGLVEMATLREICDQRKITLIEDVCQAPGAQFGGRPAGAWGDVATFSFGGSKVLTAGRGGAIATSRADIAQRIRLYSQRGNDAYPLSEMQSALLLPQWRQLSEDNAHRQEVVERLGDHPGLTRFPVSSGNQPAFYKVGFWYDAASWGGLPRERFSQALRAEGIPIDPGFPGLHQTHARRRFRAVGELPNATRACAQVVMLHHPILLEGETAVSQVRAALEKVAHHAALLRDSNTPCEPH